MFSFLIKLCKLPLSISVVISVDFQPLTSPPIALALLIVTPSDPGGKTLAWLPSYPIVWKVFTKDGSSFNTAFIVELKGKP